MTITEKQLNKKLKGKTVNTRGDGYWSTTRRATKIMKIEYDILLTNPACQDEIKYMNVYLTKKSWDTDKHGLVYTDKLWIREFRRLLKKAGFQGKVSYSEQGMQGDNYVNLDWE